MQELKRIMIIGGPGSGKSTLARQLGDKLALPVIHLDTLYWKPGWVEVDKPTFLAAVRSEAAKDQWIMEGNYTGTWPDRVARADLVLFLDVPLWRRLLRVVRRTLAHYGQSRPDLTEGCPERFTWEFFKYVWGYGGKRRDTALALCRALEAEGRSMILGPNESVEAVIDQWARANFGTRL